MADIMPEISLIIIIIIIIMTIIIIIMINKIYVVTY